MQMAHILDPLAKMEKDKGKKIIRKSKVNKMRGNYVAHACN